MRINTKIRYGLRTMIEIAQASDKGGILQKDISERQKISFKYLDVIIASLKLKGLISSVSGKGKGYMLAKPPSEITIYDIYTAFDTVHVVECVHNSLVCKISDTCKANCYWGEFYIDFVSLLQKRTLKELLESGIQSKDPMKMN